MTFAAEDDGFVIVIKIRTCTNFPIFENSTFPVAYDNSVSTVVDSTVVIILFNALSPPSVDASVLFVVILPFAEMFAVTFRSPSGIVA